MGDTMTVIELPRAFAPANVDGALMSWWDSDAECTVGIAKPSDDDDLWQRYLAGAERSYRGHGIGAALDVDAIRRCRDTTLFWTMLDATGTVVGGIRAIGPLTSPDETHAVTEWAGQPSRPTVRKMIADRIPFGVVEMKSAWVTDDPDRSRRLTASLARTGCHVLAVLGVQFCMATCAYHVLARWRSSGGVVAPIPSTPYPDDRYRTKMMWWDRQTVASLAAPSQTAKIVAEMANIRQRLHSSSRHATVGS
jgi:GNAT superfamily N-acetyltransferase